MFVSEELTVWFKGEPQAVHVLCYGITPEDHEWLQAHNDSVEDCAEYLNDREITAALAHPFFAVEAPLTPRHRRRLAQLFPIWETRNGSRAKELNLPAFVYIETHGGTGIGGTDDHAGIDIGRTFTETPQAAQPGGVPGAHPRRRCRLPRRPGRRREVDARGDGARDPRARRRRGRRPSRPRRGAEDRRAGHERGQRPLGRGAATTSARRTRSRCCAPGSAR